MASKMLSPRLVAYAVSPYLFPCRCLRKPGHPSAALSWPRPFVFLAGGRFFVTTDYPRSKFLCFYQSSIQSSATSLMVPKTIFFCPYIVFSTNLALSLYVRGALSSLSLTPHPFHRRTVIPSHVNQYPRSPLRFLRPPSPSSVLFSPGCLVCSHVQYRGACPQSRTDDELLELVKKMGGDEAKIQSALDDWWQSEIGFESDSELLRRGWCSRGSCCL